MSELPILPSGTGTVSQVCFDLDGTLAKSVWPVRREIGSPIQRGVDILNHYAQLGYSICVYTARPQVDEPAIWEWILANNLPVDKVRCEKPMAALYVDDKAWRFEDE